MKRLLLYKFSHPSFTTPYNPWIRSEKEEEEKEKEGEKEKEEIRGEEGEGGTEMEIKRRNSSHKVNGNHIARDLDFLNFLVKKSCFYCKCLL
jgi:hypothetical protein